MAAGVSNRFIGVKNSNAVDLYLSIEKATPLITSPASVDDEAITVNSIANIAAGDVITISEGSNLYQSLVKSAAVNDINLATPLDFAFTIDAGISTGDWNLNVNGSVATKTAQIIIPSCICLEIYQLTVSMTDDAAMDSGKFGGIAALTNGIFFRVVNGVAKNLPIIVNNMGFMEFGFDTQYETKAPAGTYGFSAKKNYYTTNGVVLKLDGATNDTIQCHIRDNLTDLSLLAITVNGRAICA